MRSHRNNPDRRGFTIIDLACAVAAAAILVIVAVPALAGVGTRTGVDQSLANLLTLGVAHTIYAADYNGRQYTNVDDALSTYGDVASSAFNNYQSTNGQPHPPQTLGWGAGFSGGGFSFYAYSTSFGGGNQALVQPIVFPAPQSFTYFGSFRFPNSKALHDYVGGRFHDDPFYAPRDTVPYEIAEPLFAETAEYVPTAGSALGDTPVWSSYCLSPAAMFHPDVMRAPPDGGWQDPWLLDHAFESPGLFQAMYPSLKTQLIEHNWNQNAPTDVCIPDYDTPAFDDCEPYYFNHGLASEPASLFYDLSTRLFPNTEAIAADMMVMDETGYGLWSRDTSFGEAGYRGEYGYDLFGPSHHILTTGGILGRDTVSIPAGAAKEVTRVLRLGPGTTSPVPPGPGRSRPTSAFDHGPWEDG